MDMTGNLSSEQGMTGNLSSGQGLTATLTNQQGLSGTLSNEESMIGELSSGETMTGQLSSPILDYYTKQEANAKFALKDVVSVYETHFNFPNLGKDYVIYVATEENKTYRWDADDMRYYCVGSDYSEIKIIDGGNANG